MKISAFPKIFNELVEFVEDMEKRMKKLEKKK